MSEVKWIKISTGMFDSRKIKQIERIPKGDTILIIWLKLLLLAGSVNDGGAVYLTPEVPYSLEDLANELRRPLSVVKSALDVFQKYGMIEIENNIIYLVNWEKYQSVDRLTDIREYNRIAQQKSRAKKKELKSVNDKSMISQETVNGKSLTSQRGHETDKEIRDKNKDIHTSYVREREQKESGLTPPSLEEITAFCKERNSPVNPKRFYDYFSTTGWKDSNGKAVKSWQQKLISWETYEKSNKVEEDLHSSFDIDEFWEANIKHHLGDEFYESVKRDEQKTKSKSGE